MFVLKQNNPNRSHSASSADLRGPTHTPPRTRSSSISDASEAANSTKTDRSRRRPRSDWSCGCVWTRSPSNGRFLFVYSLQERSKLVSPVITEMSDSTKRMRQKIPKRAEKRREKTTETPRTITTTIKGRKSTDGPSHPSRQFREIEILWYR